MYTNKAGEIFGHGQDWFAGGWKCSVFGMKKVFSRQPSAGGGEWAAVASPRVVLQGSLLVVEMSQV